MCCHRGCGFFPSSAAHSGLSFVILFKSKIVLKESSLVYENTVTFKFRKPNSEILTAQHTENNKKMEVY